MTITSTMDEQSSTLTITVRGRFDFSAHKEFRDAYMADEAAPGEYVIDMQEAEYIDSSALGMLLLLRDHAGGDKAEVTIAHCNADVKKILTISNFHQLFTIH